MELVIPLKEEDEKAKSKHHQHHQPGEQHHIAFWFLFAAIYLALFLFNVSILGFQFVNGTIDAAEAASVSFFSGAGLATAVGLFLWNTCLRPTRHAWMLYFVFSLSTFVRAAVLFSRHEWFFSFCFGLGSVCCFLVTFCARNVLQSMAAR